MSEHEKASASNYIYLYEKTSPPPGLYIGVGSLERITQPHNSDAERLRDHPETNILVTANPFSTPEDARLAEALLIRLASNLGLKETTDSDTPEQGLLTNLSGTVSSSLLVPSMPFQDRSVDMSYFKRTAFVTLTPAALAGDPRPSVHGGRTPAELAERATKYWPLGKALTNGYAPHHLVAILKGARRILAHWRLDENAPIIEFEDGNYGFRLTDVNDWDIEGLRGAELTNREQRVGTLVTWSQDIRVAQGLF